MAAKKDEKKTSTLKELRQMYGRPEVQFIPTNNPVLDELWGGGTPTGKIIEIHSDAGLGKTTLALQTARPWLTRDMKVGFMDVESALETSLKQGMGISEYEEKLDEKKNPYFLHLTPSMYSEVEQTMDFLLENNYKLIIFDSLTMAVPDRRKEGSFNDVQPGLKSQLQSQFLEQYKADLGRSGSSLIVLNQMRMKISFIPGASGLVPAGGSALQFDTDIRTGLRRVNWIDENKQREGAILEAVCIKNKLVKPFRTANMYLYFGKGVNVLKTLKDILIMRDIVTQSGAYFKVPPDGKTVMGNELLFDWIRDNKEMVQELLKDKYTDLYNPRPEEIAKVTEEGFSEQPMGTKPLFDQQ